MQYAVRIEKVEPRLLAAAQGHASMDAIPAKIHEVLDHVWPYVKGSHIPTTGINVVLYRPGNEPGCAAAEGLQMEAGAQVLGEFPESEHVVRSATPAGIVATAAHIGPYNLLGEAHAAIHRCCKKHGHELAGPNWEVYDHWNDDQTKLRTDVFYLLKEDA